MEDVITSNSSNSTGTDGGTKRGLLSVEDETSGTSNNKKMCLLRLGKRLEEERIQRTKWESYMKLASDLLLSSSSSSSSSLLETWKDLAGSGQIQKSSQIHLFSHCLQQASNTITPTTTTNQNKIDQDDLKQWLTDCTTTTTTTDDDDDTNLALSTLEEQIQELRTYHAKHPSTTTTTTTTTTLEDHMTSCIRLEMERHSTLFTEEEVYGKYLDLHTHCSTYNSIISTSTKLPYVDYCQLLSSIQDHNHTNNENNDAINMLNQKKKKKQKQYYSYTVTLIEYLKNFLQKTNPLLQIQRDVIDPALSSSSSSSKLTTTKKYNKDTIADMLQPYENANQLCQQWEADELKQALSDLNMKCGGTPLDRAKRLFLCKHTPFSNLPNKVLLGNNNNNNKKQTLEQLELILVALLEQLRPILDATIRRAERILTQTYTERQRELEEELYGINNNHNNNTTSLVVKKKKNKKNKDTTNTDASSDNNNDNEEDEDSEEDIEEDSEEEDAPIYNPKGVPLGWDGKPIPYWLFKLHGLNHFYHCEICGNESYRGRRNFEKHFTEAKHSHGMKCLGIPNTQHFHGITQIDDAQKLWNQLQSNLSSTLFDGETQEEYEDSHGNILTRATYEDLARQGLL